ncbi:N-methyl-D-aspartate receptor NMDAR2C subunit [Candidatus Uhrbacteria bacterium]|nr:N-methyl-D-aspartate receptor NMDAR2C subunit [Candidatus Uhrbacteria bacterium]
MQQLRTRWTTFWQRIGAAGDGPALFEQLARCYEHEDRAYHNLTHIAACMADLDEVRSQLNGPDEVTAEAALWFHDVIYLPGIALNEQYSEEFAAWALFEVGEVPDKTLRPRVHDAILATKRHAHSPNLATRVVVDIDLGILGAEPARCAQYCVAIRQEYSFLDERTFATGRLAFLQKLAKRKSLYHTTHFQKKYEARARENIDTEIRMLHTLLRR